jgi:hypothetical protein
VSSGSGVLVFECCCFCCFWAWLCCVRGCLRWCRAWWRAGPRLPVMLPGGAVEARRSRVPRSGIALATPKAPLTWEGRPRRLRGTTADTHAHSTTTPKLLRACCCGWRRGWGVLLGVVVVGAGGMLQVGFPVGGQARWGLSVIPSLRVVAWSATTGAVGRGQSRETTRQGVGVMTDTTRAGRGLGYRLMRRCGSAGGCARRAARRRPVR